MEEGGATTGPKKPTTPGGISLFTSREMPFELKLRMRYLKFIIHLCSHMPHDVRPPLGKRSAVGKFSQRIFQSRIFTAQVLSREFSRRALPRCIYIFFYLVANCLRVANFSLCTLCLSCPTWARKCVLCRAFSRHKFSLVMHFSILSLDTLFPPNTLFLSRTFSLYARLFSMFSHPLASSRFSFFFFLLHPLLHHGLPRRSFSSRNFLLFLCCVFLSPKPFLLLISM